MGRNSKLVLQISIHALREERDDFVGFKIWATHRFQSTRSARSATKYKADQSGGKTNFNPRAPRGARLKAVILSAEATLISIHALREERDNGRKGQLYLSPEFQSTRSARSATSSRASGRLAAGYFNPRAPRGARPAPASPPADSGRNFNPRAPRGARRPGWPRGRVCSCNFNPRAPRGARRDQQPHLRG